MDYQNDLLDDAGLVGNSDIEVQTKIWLSKFIVLSLLSFGIYGIWWIYKAWRFFKQKENLDIMPVARAIFSIFFLSTLFSKILVFAKETGYNKSYSASLLFFCFIIGNVLSKLPEPFSLISVFSTLFLIRPFQALNYAMQNSTEVVVSSKTSFNVFEIILIVLGVLLWALTIIGITQMV